MASATLLLRPLAVGRTVGVLILVAYVFQLVALDDGGVITTTSRDLLAPTKVPRWRRRSRPKVNGSRVSAQTALNGSVPFAHYVLALTAPAGFCNVTSKCNRTKQDGKSLPWTIHGLWPSNSNVRTSPISCPISAKFSVDKFDRRLLERLNYFWPTYMLRSNTRFWRHEWLKHGSCSVNHSRITGPRDYFETTLDLFSKYNLTNYLENDGVTARTDKPYKTVDFFKAISNDLLDKNINVVCSRRKNVSVVTEVRLCFNETGLDIIDCPWKSSSCRKTLFYLPAATTAESRQVDEDKPATAGSGQMDEDKPTTAGSGQVDEDKPTTAGSGQVDEDKPVTAGSGQIDGDKPTTAGSGQVDEDKPLTAGSGQVNEDKPTTAGSGQVDEDKPATAGSGQVDEDKPVTAESGQMDEHKPTTAGSGQVDEDKPVTAGSGQVNEDKPTTAGSKQVDEDKPATAGSGQVDEYKPVTAGSGQVSEDKPATGGSG